MKQQEGGWCRAGSKSWRTNTLLKLLGLGKWENRQTAADFKHLLISPNFWTITESHRCHFSSFQVGKHFLWLKQRNISLSLPGSFFARKDSEVKKKKCLIRNSCKRYGVNKKQCTFWISDRFSMRNVQVLCHCWLCGLFSTLYYFYYKFLLYSNHYSSV